MTRFKKIILALVAVLILTYFFVIKKNHVDVKPEKEVPVETFKVVETDISDEKPVAATVDSVHRTFARSRINGTVVSIDVTEGQAVNQGQLIAKVNNPTFASEVESIDAKIKSLEEQFNLAKTDFERAKKLKSSNVISQSKFDEAQTKLKVVENNLKSLQSDRETQLEHHKEGDVFAPLSGKVLTIPATKGQVVMMGENVIEIAGDALVLKVTAPESHAHFLKLNDKIAVRLNDDIHKIQKNITGTVQKIYPKLASGQILADVSCDNLSDLYVGQTVTAYLKTATHKGFLVPKSYVFERRGLNYVRLKDLGEIVVQQNVLNNKDHVEIVSGLKVADEIVKP